MTSKLSQAWAAIPCGILTLGLSLACSSSDGNTPTIGGTSSQSKARLLVASDASSSVQVIDLEQRALEIQSKSFSNSPKLLASPEGNYAFVSQSSGNRINILKMGTSTPIVSASTTSSTDDHGHQHKAREAAGHDHDHGSTTSSAETSSTTSSASSSVESLEHTITGQNPGVMVSKGQWITFQFQDKVIAIAEESLETYQNSLTEPLSSHTHQWNSSFPGVPLDAHHISLGANVVHIESGELEHRGTSASANALIGANILSATRSAEGLALYGTDHGLLVVCKHTETGNVQWEDFFVSYPTVSENQIFLATGNDHEHEEEGHEEEGEHAGEDEHAEVEAHRAATAWATHDGIGHAFVHLSHESHSAGVYLLEAQSIESNGVSSAWSLLPDTSNAKVRPLAMTIAKMPEHAHEGEAHADEYRLLILMSDGSLRIHDAVNEGALLKVIPNVISSVDDFHAGEGHMPGLAAGKGKVWVGNPKTKSIHQIDLESYQVELSWNVSNPPNHLLVLGESSLAEASAHHHD